MLPMLVCLHFNLRHLTTGKEITEMTSITMQNQLF